MLNLIVNHTKFILFFQTKMFFSFLQVTSNEKLIIERTIIDNEKLKFVSF